MKNGLMLFLMLFVATSCGIFTRTITLNDVVQKKIQIDETANPAQKVIITNSLKKDGFFAKEIVLKNVVVKDVTESTNIDYQFCVVVDAIVEKRRIECYVYSKNIYKISQLKNNKTKIDIIGKFERFFTMLDEYYTKLEIVDAVITIR